MMKLLRKISIRKKMIKMQDFSRNEVIKYLKITEDILHKMESDSLIIYKDNADRTYPLFQFNGTALDLNVIVLYQLFQKKDVSTEFFIKWFTSQNIIIDDVPYDYIKKHGIDETLKESAKLSIDISYL